MNIKLNNNEKPDILWFEKTRRHQNQDVKILCIIDVAVSYYLVQDNIEWVLEYVNTMLKKQEKSIGDYRVIYRNQLMEWNGVSFQLQMTGHPFNVQLFDIGLSDLGMAINRLLNVEEVPEEVEGEEEPTE